MFHKTEDNVVLIGRSGSGKHLFATHRLVTSLVEGKSAAVFDYGHSYFRLAQALGGTLVNVKNGGDATVERFGSLPLTVFELGDLTEKLPIDAFPHLPVLDSNTFVLVDEAFQMEYRVPGFWAWLKAGADVDSQFCGVLQMLGDVPLAELPAGTQLRAVHRYAIAETDTLIPGQFVRHQDGGIYQFLALARHTDDQAEHVIYSHVWPFESGQTWARPAHEWASRFTPITQSEVRFAQRQNRLAAQEAVSNAKAARRAAAAAAQHASDVLSPGGVTGDFHLIRAQQSASDLASPAQGLRFNPLESGLELPAAHVDRFISGVTCVNRKGELVQLDPFKAGASLDVADASSGAGASKQVE